MRIWCHCSSALNHDLPSVRAGRHGAWDDALNFEHPAALAAELESRHLSGRISTLVINCHGDFGGHLRLDVELGPDSADSAWRSRFEPLARFLTPLGRLWFTGCAFAEGEAGTRSMSRLSAMLAGRVLIANDRESYVESLNLPYVPGAIRLHDTFPITDPSDVAAFDLHVSVHHPACKWVRNGVVLRYPRQEQSLRPHNRCAAPACIGHCHPTHQCDGAWNPGCDWHAGPPLPAGADCVRAHVPGEAARPPGVWSAEPTSR